MMMTMALEDSVGWQGRPPVCDCGVIDPTLMRRKPLCTRGSGASCHPCYLTAIA